MKRLQALLIGQAFSPHKSQVHFWDWVIEGLLADGSAMGKIQPCHLIWLRGQWLDMGSRKNLWFKTKQLQCLGRGNNHKSGNLKLTFYTHVVKGSYGKWNTRYWQSKCSAQAINGTGNYSPILGGPEKTSSIENNVELDALTLRSASKLTSGGASAIQDYGDWEI